MFAFLDETTANTLGYSLAKFAVLIVITGAVITFVNDRVTKRSARIFPQLAVRALGLIVFIAVVIGGGIYFLNSSA